MVGPKVVVYGLCTEGYDLACTMVLKGATSKWLMNQTGCHVNIKFAKRHPNIWHSMKVMIIDSVRLLDDKTARRQ